MFFLIALNHPAHYHLFKNFRKEMILRGHKIVFTLKEKEILSKLLDAEGVEYIRIIKKNYARKQNRISIIRSNIIELIKSDIGLYKYIKSNKPDFMLGTDVSIAHLSTLTKIPSFVFNEDDIEINKLFCYSAYPFTKYIVSPASCNVGRYGYKRIKYNGYQKLAYLHPNRFTPNANSLNATFKRSKRNFIVRMVSFTAGHDIEQKHSGISETLLDKLIDKLKNHGQIHISSEKEIPDKYSQYKLDINIADIHNYLAASDIFISDSQSMTVEACMLGTPSLRFNTFARKISVLNELETKYQLTYGYHIDDETNFLNKFEELINTPYLKSIYQERRNKMLNDKIDLTAFLIWLFENFPDSISKLKINPDIQHQFK